MIERRIHENKCRSLDINIFLSNPFNKSSVLFHKEIQEHQYNIEHYVLLRNHFLEYYQESTRQLNNHNITEL